MFSLSFGLVFPNSQSNAGLEYVNTGSEAHTLALIAFLVVCIKPLSVVYVLAVKVNPSLNPLWF